MSGDREHPGVLLVSTAVYEKCPDRRGDHMAKDLMAMAGDLDGAAQAAAPPGIPWRVAAKLEFPDG